MQVHQKPMIDPKMTMATSITSRPTREAIVLATATSRLYINIFYIKIYLQHHLKSIYGGWTLVTAGRHPTTSSVVPTRPRPSKIRSYMRARRRLTAWHLAHIPLEDGTGTESGLSGDGDRRIGVKRGFPSRSADELGCSCGWIRGWRSVSAHCKVPGRPSPLSETYLERRLERLARENKAAPGATTYEANRSRQKTTASLAIMPPPSSHELVQRSVSPPPTQQHVDHLFDDFNHFFEQAEICAKTYATTPAPAALQSVKQKFKERRMNLAITSQHLHDSDTTRHAMTKLILFTPEGC